MSQESKIQELKPIAPVINIEAGQNADRAPESIPLDKSNQILRTNLEINKMNDSQIRNFNVWIDQIPRQLRGVIHGQNRYYFISDVMLVKPTQDVGADIKELLPKHARNQGKTYSMSVYATLSMVEKKDYPYSRYEVEKRLTERNPDHFASRESKLLIGTIPVMLGSKMCHLDNLSDDEILQKGECPYVSRGSFIINGNNRLVIAQEKGRILYPLLYRESAPLPDEPNFFQIKKRSDIKTKCISGSCRLPKGGVTINITSQILNRSQKTILRVGKKGNIKMNLSFLGSQRHLGIFQLFRMWGFRVYQPYDHPILKAEIMAKLGTVEPGKDIWIRIHRIIHQNIPVTKEAVIGFLNGIDEGSAYWAPIRLLAFPPQDDLPATKEKILSFLKRFVPTDNPEVWDRIYLALLPSLFHLNKLTDDMGHLISKLGPKPCRRGCGREEKAGEEMDLDEEGYEQAVINARVGRGRRVQSPAQLERERILHVDTPRMEKEIWVNNKLDQEFFPQVNSNPHWGDDYDEKAHFPLSREEYQLEKIHRAKLGYLAFMTVRLSEHLAQLIPLDDRDSWGFKRVDTASQEMKLVLGSTWKNLLTKIQTEISKAPIDDEAEIGKIEKELRDSWMHTAFVKNAFIENRWKIGGQQAQEVKSAVLSMETLLSLYSQYTLSNVQASRQSRISNIRDVKEDQFGYICHTQTPEGKNCGINKNRSNGAFISHDHDEKNIFDVLYATRPLINEWIEKHSDPRNLFPFLSNDYKSGAFELAENKVEDLDFSQIPAQHPLFELIKGNPRRIRFQLNHTTPILYNGIMVGWADGQYLRDWLIKFRRLSDQAFQIPTDTEVTFLRNKTENVLFIFTDSARLCRYVLVINPATGIPIVEEKKMWNASWDDLWNEGCLDCLSPMEEETKYVASSIWEIEDLHREIENKREEKRVISQKIDSFRNDLTINGPSSVVISQRKAPLRKAGTIPIERSPDELEEIIEPLIYEISPEDLANLRAGRETVLTNRLKTLEVELKNSIERSKFDYCDIDPASVLSYITACAPFPDHNQGPRNSLESAMTRQALGIIHSNQDQLFLTSAKTLAYPTRGMLETFMQEAIGLDELPYGENIEKSIQDWEGFTQEDASALQKEAIDRGLFTYVKTTTVIGYHNRIRSNKKDIDFIKHPASMERDSFEGNIDLNSPTLRHLDSYGVARLNSRLKPGDVIMTKWIHSPAKEGENERGKEFPDWEKATEDSTVDRIRIEPAGSGSFLIKIRLREVRRFQVGDKIKSEGDAQKRTIGKITSARNFPRTKNGITPTFLVNPHCIPSRMTVSSLIRPPLTKLASLEGHRYNVTPFRPFDEEGMRRALVRNGYDQFGNEQLYSGITGKAYPDKSFIGPDYCMVLRHHVLDKIQARSERKYNMVTREPLGGRSESGGKALRVGEMEHDAIASHGASSLLQERLCFSAGRYQAPICKKCGQIAVTEMKKGEIVRVYCNHNGRGNPEQSPENFNWVIIPYGFKLLMQLMGACNYKISLNTEIPNFVKPKIEEFYSQFYDSEVDQKQILQRYEQILPDEIKEFKAKSPIDQYDTYLRHMSQIEPPEPTKLDNYEYIGTIFEDARDRRKKFQITNVGIFSATRTYESRDIANEMFKSFEREKRTDVHITDATAGVGGNTIEFVKKFGRVHAVEASRITTAVLQNNLSQNRDEKAKYTVINGDITNPELNVPDLDAIFFDPPWGGKRYNEIKEIKSLYLGGKDLQNIILGYLRPNKKIKVIGFKVPENFNRNFETELQNKLKEKYGQQVLIVINRKNYLRNDGTVKFSVIYIVRTR